MISVQQGIELAQRLEPKFAEFGYHIGLTGSVLFKGTSEKDIDFVLYPHDPEKTLGAQEIAYKIATFADKRPWCITDSPYVNRTVIIASIGGVRVDFLLP